MFDHEKLDVYRLQLAFVEWLDGLLSEIKPADRTRTREVRDQLDRASISSVLNTAEGNGKRQRPVRAKFFDDARGSAAECAACLDVLVAKHVFPRVRIHEGKQMLARIGQMLTKLVTLYSDTGMLRDETVEYRAD